jgi:hypothetical protein
MRFQLLSDLHLETETFSPRPAPDAEMLVLAGDVDSTWAGLELFKDWPVPVLCIAGNHEFDGRDLTTAWPQLRERCESLGIELFERQSVVKQGDDGRRIRFVCTVRWCDFDLFGPSGRDKALRAAGYFQKVMRATIDGRTFDAPAVREEALDCRAWLAAELDKSRDDVDATVVITHFGPSMRSADPRYGKQPGTASFLNDDEDLLPKADLWIHGHVHCRHDYVFEHAQGGTRVVCNARGHSSRHEADDYDGSLVISV